MQAASAGRDEFIEGALVALLDRLLRASRQSNWVDRLRGDANDQILRAARGKLRAARSRANPRAACSHTWHTAPDGTQADRQLLGRISRASSTRDWIVCRVSSASDLPSLLICSNSD